MPPPLPYILRSARSLAQNLPECLGLVFDCSDPVPRCRNSAGFDFNTLWNITQQYENQCPSGPWLFRPSGVIGAIPTGEASLSNLACEVIAGKTWKAYTSPAIWYRLTTWKFVLFQLISLFPRPPLGFVEEAFTIVHLLGDPIGSFSELVQKLSDCQDRAQDWRDLLAHDLNFPPQSNTELNDLDQQRLWKALTLIVLSYDEWGPEVGTSVRNYLEEELIAFCAETEFEKDRDKFIRQCLNSASRLAADRATKFLPVIFAQAFFIGNVIIAIVRTKSLAEGPSPQTYIDIETYSIAFTALYFWLIATVTIASVIGSSQTANAMPDILTDFRRGLSEACPGRNLDLPLTFDPDQRYRRGGIYSWHSREMAESFHGSTAASVLRHLARSLARNMRMSSAKRKQSRTLLWTCKLLPFLSVSAAVITGIVLAARVPPVGWSCRSVAEITIFAIWLLSYPLTLIPWGRHHRTRFWLTFAKDFVAMGATLGLIIATQIGIFNKCSCYNQNGNTFTAFPQVPIVKAILENRLVSEYPAITAVGIGAQLVIFPGIILASYYQAVQVFLQRDDGEKILPWCHKAARWCATKTRASKERTKQSRSVATVQGGHELGEVRRIHETEATRLSEEDDEKDRIKHVALHVRETGPELSHTLELWQPSRNVPAGT